MGYLYVCHVLFVCFNAKHKCIYMYVYMYVWKQHYGYKISRVFTHVFQYIQYVCMFESFCNRQSTFLQNTLTCAKNQFVSKYVCMYVYIYGRVNGRMEWWTFWVSVCRRIPNYVPPQKTCCSTHGFETLWTKSDTMVHSILILYIHTYIHTYLPIIRYGDKWFLIVLVYYFSGFL